MHSSISSQFDSLGISKNLELVQRAQRLLDVGLEHRRYNKPWQPLLSRHEFDEMMEIPECRDILRKARDMYLGSRPVFKKKERTITRGFIPETLEVEDDPEFVGSPKWRRACMKYKYIRDCILNLGTNRVVVDYKEYFVYDLDDLNKLIRHWFNSEWDKCQKNLWYKETNHA